MATKAMSNPETLQSYSEIADIVSQLDEFEKLHNVTAAVVERQNLSFGASYAILAEEESRSQLKKWRGCDIYLQIWPKQYFIDLLAQYQK